MGSTTLLALNGSPKGRAGNTEMLLQAFLAGAVEAGAEAKTVYVKDLDVKFCRGCFTCWNVTPGRCVLTDDVPPLLEGLRQSDIVVWATPLYHYGMTAMAKALLERTLPLSEPYMVRIGGRIRNPAREGVKAHKLVLISNCGYPERSNFAALEEQMAQMIHDKDQLAGMILCAGGPWLQGAPRQIVQWYLDAARQAGREVVEAGRISDETSAVLARPLVAPEDYVRIVNQQCRVPGDMPPATDEAPGEK